MTWLPDVMETMVGALQNTSLVNETSSFDPLQEDVLTTMARRLSSPSLLPREQLLFLFNLTDEDIAYFHNMTAGSGSFGKGNSVGGSPQCYCSGWAGDVADAYKQAHGYVSLVVCIFGTVANLLNVAVLTRKDMANAPINRILTWLAVADMLVMAEYVPFASYTYLVLPERVDFHFPYSWAVFILFHVHFAQVLHTISICLTLALAVWRYIAIRFPQKSHIWCSEFRCRLAIVLSYTAPVLVCSPSYFVFQVRETRIVEDNKEVLLYHVETSDVARENDGILFTANFWMYSVVVKLLPCLVLTILSCWLIQALYKANKRKQELKGHSNPATPSERRPLSKSERRTDRTTKMLVAVLLLFFITEFPQGVLGLLSGILGRCFFQNCYHRFGEIMDMLALLNGAINFILYCSMSRQFRTTFGHLFKPRSMLAKWATPSQTEVQSTFV
uniref:G-protein coupled receptors family 1 profile domain-containing protein n=1 Tax=Timema poppense TaxID=170557 RepID=A0A7R9D8U9_TIMPO|nr:unnamed protein product [Timema poppensis]